MAIASVFVILTVDTPWVRVLLAVPAVVASVLCVVLVARQARDPNGPPGQH